MFEFMPVTVEAIKEIGNWRYDGFVKSVYLTSSPPVPIVTNEDS